MFNVEQLGQVFTPQYVVAEMLQLRQRYGTVLEPSAGNGSFFSNIPGCVGIEIDERHCRAGMLNMDFFDFPLHNTFDTIIGNPPYVRYQDIPAATKKKINKTLFDERSNLYLFFIEKCIRHLNYGGELIFITPRDFLKATSSIKLNKFLYEQGSITDIIDLGDSRIFNSFNPNCIIWRFEKGNFARTTNVTQQFTYFNGQLLFTNNHYSVSFRDIFFVRVGAVSGCDSIYTNNELGDTDFVCSDTYKTGRTRRMIFTKNIDYLEQHKIQLIQRRIRKFDETNWWQWGRLHYMSEAPRIYVNCKTRTAAPFFTHPCNNYDGSVLAIFPHNTNTSTTELARMLNSVDWSELGFVCDGRFLFSQRSLENTLLPDYFERYTRTSIPRLSTAI